VDVPEVLDHLGLPCKPGSGGFYTTDCTEDCRVEGKPGLGFKIMESGWWVAVCFKCGRKPVAATLAELAGVPVEEIYPLLGGRHGSEDAEHERRGNTRLLVPEGELGRLRHAHREYLRGRGFNPQVLVRLWGLRGTTIAESPYQWRVFIPIFDLVETGLRSRWKMVSWTTRSIGTNPPRYLSAPAECEITPAKSLLYGAWQANHQQSNSWGRIIICEGPADVWNIGPGSVAVLGTGFSEEQVQRLGWYPKRFIVFDSDRKAQERARDLAYRLKQFEGCTNIVAWDAADPGAATTEQIIQLRKLCGMQPWEPNPIKQGSFSRLWLDWNDWRKRAKPGGLWWRLDKT
jgi:hypothetical protein